MKMLLKYQKRARILCAATIPVLAVAACSETQNETLATNQTVDESYNAIINPQVAEAIQAADKRLPYPQRPAIDDIIYFVLPDRFENGDPTNDLGGIKGNRLDHGFDPSHPKFYHGGDLKGLTARLDYLQELGVTAVWFTPVYKNKAVQGRGDDHSSGYHGYWVTDFTRVDPHLGSPEDFRAFVDAAHARDMKVILDIITNHTADVIQYRECHDPDFAGKEKLPACSYRSRQHYPYTQFKADPAHPINNGFLGDEPEHQTPENFALLTRPDYAYTPFVREEELGIKAPAWLNDPIYYHNRGETTFSGENSLFGDFVGLDDLFTEHPSVVQGFIDIYKQWITDFRVDGFRVDTVKHVNGEFWQAFAPAILDHARTENIEKFYIFGEVYSSDIDVLSSFTNDHKLPAVLDFGFQSAIVDVASGKGGPSVLANLFANDTRYQNGANAELMLPTFTGNHDMGRFGYFLARARPDMPDEEALARTILAHGLMIFSRGIPVIYYGDEQGFVGDGNDADARETMFPSKVASYNDNNLVGTEATTAQSNFDTSHPLFQAIKKFNTVHQAEPALRRGSQTVLRADSEAGILIVQRQVPGSDDHVLVIANTADRAVRTSFPLNQHHTVTALLGACEKSSDAPVLDLTLSPLELRVCKISPS